MRVLVLAFVFLAQVLCAEEYISQFISDITIHQNATLSVTETITVHADGNQIKRGIMRELPTRYATWWGKNMVMPFTLIQVMRDGRPENYRIEQLSNGIRVYIGDPNQQLTPGIYTYKISYTTDRQIGFFEKYDELAWNVNGTGWRLPIEKIVTYVHLPTNIPAESISMEAYTGYAGNQGKDYRVQQKNHTIIFENTQQFKPFENLTVVLTWPKGYVDNSPWWQRIIWWFSDMLGILALIFATSMLALYYFIMYTRSRATIFAYTVIPRFYPPQDSSPGMVRFIMRRGYDAQTLAAELIAMAVQGYMKIVYKKGWISGTYYLEALATPKEFAVPLHQKLWEVLFSQKKQVALDKGSNAQITVLNTVTERYVETATAGYFTSYSEQLFFGIGVYVCALAVLWYFFPAIFLVGIGGLCVAICMLVVCAYMLNYYTREGQKIKAEIEGFKLFLSTTETERMEEVGTPPNRTPELYETYLPYAVALGVEKQWTQQFAQVFKKLQAAGTPYAPSWQIAPSGYSIISQPALFSSQLGSALSSSVAAAPMAPGTGTSSGGRGSSGSGGGGGGGGGW